METKVILLIEDNEQDELLTLRALKKCNISNPVVVLRDGQEALDFLFAQGGYSGRNLKDLPQVVLLDLKLPKVEGLDVLKRIRSHAATKTLPVVILTTSQEDRDVHAGYECGANSYVRKPVDGSQFYEAVRSLGMYWLLLNVPPISQP